MNPKFAKFVCLLVFVMMGLSAMAQNATTATDVVPHLINYSGLLKDIDGKTLNSISGVTFLIYKDEQGDCAASIHTVAGTQPGLLSGGNGPGLGRRSGG